MPRLQFSVKTLLWLMLVVAAFVSGIHFERARLEKEWAALDHLQGLQEASNDDWRRLNEEVMAARKELGSIREKEQYRLREQEDARSRLPYAKSPLTKQIGKRPDVDESD